MVFAPVAPAAADVTEARRMEGEAIAPADPQEAILMYGKMLVDLDIMSSELRTLLFSGSDYRSKLRVLRSASMRMSDRAAKLLGD